MATNESNTGRLVYKKDRRHDRWIGSAGQLEDAGIVGRHQLPGEPGHKNKVGATYYNGNLVRKSSLNPRDKNYMCITRQGNNRFCVLKYVSKQEQDLRETQQRLSETSPSIDFGSLPPPRFLLGEMVCVESSHGFGIGAVVDIRYAYEDEENGWPALYWYKVEPSPSKTLIWFGESLVSKRFSSEWFLGDRKFDFTNESQTEQDEDRPLRAKRNTRGRKK